MELRILQVPGCPHGPLLRQRLDDALAGTATGVEVAVRMVGDAEEAAATGMTGSPTLLVDGTDPFAAPGDAPSMSCRLYEDADGRLSGAPPVTALQRVLRRQAKDAG